MYFVISFFCLFFAFIQLSATQDSSTLHRYVWANYSHFSGKNENAHHWYKKIFVSNNSPYTYKGYLHFLFNTKQFETILALMPSLNKKFMHDIDVQLIFVHTLEHNNNIKQAENLIISLCQSCKTNPDIALRAAQIYIQRNEIKNALLTVESFLNNTPRRPHNFVFYFLKSQIYMQLSQFNEALENINKCLELHPHFDKGWLLQASLYEKEGKIKEALSGYATFLELSGGNSGIEHHLSTLMLKYKMIEDNKKILLSHSTNIENALILFNQKRYVHALTHINKCIELNPTDTECKLLKLQILSVMKDFAQVTQILSLWLAQDPESDIWPKAAFLLTHNGMLRKDAIAMLKELIIVSPDNTWLNLYCADLYMREHNNCDALNCLNNALHHINDKKLRSTILYQLAILYYEQENYSAMLIHLEKSYELYPNSGHINNALAYYWVTKGKDLVKARAFIEKALAINNTNPYFLDTLALLLYKEKKYEEAQRILEQLLEQNEYKNNGTMLLHSAKIHYTLKNKQMADTRTKQAESVVQKNNEKKALVKMQSLLAS